MQAIYFKVLRFCLKTYPLCNKIQNGGNGVLVSIKTVINSSIIKKRGLDHFDSGTGFIR